MSTPHDRTSELIGSSSSRRRQHVTPQMDECWSKIGVAGDRSCPELESFIHCRNCPVRAEAARTFSDREPPEGYLETWSEILQTPEEETETDAVSMLIFRVGREWLSLATPLLVEVTEMKPLHTIPHRRAGVLEGIVNIRGQIQLCVSLAKLLGIDVTPELNVLQTPLAPLSGEGSAKRLLVLEDGDERWVVAVANSGFK